MYQRAGICVSTASSSDRHLLSYDLVKDQISFYSFFPTWLQLINKLENLHWNSFLYVFQSIQSVLLDFSNLCLDYIKSAAILRSV